MQNEDIFMGTSQSDVVESELLVNKEKSILKKGKGSTRNFKNDEKLFVNEGK